MSLFLNGVSLIILIVLKVRSSMKSKSESFNLNIELNLFKFGVLLLSLVMYYLSLVQYKDFGNYVSFCVVALVLFDYVFFPTMKLHNKEIVVYGNRVKDEVTNIHFDKGRFFTRVRFLNFPREVIFITNKSLSKVTKESKPL